MTSYTAEEIRALAALAAFLTGCSSAALDSGPDRFSVKDIEGTKCIVRSPYDETGDGSQMECDFR